MFASYFHSPHTLTSHLSSPSCVYGPKESLDAWSQKIAYDLISRERAPVLVVEEDYKEQLLVALLQDVSDEEASTAMSVWRQGQINAKLTLDNWGATI